MTMTIENENQVFDMREVQGTINGKEFTYLYDSSCQEVEIEGTLSKKEKTYIMRNLA